MALFNTPEMFTTPSNVAQKPTWLTREHMTGCTVCGWSWSNSLEPACTCSSAVRSEAPTLNTDRTVAVSNEVYWVEDMTACPRGCKVQLLGAGGVAVYGMYDGKDPFWVGWQAVPRRRKS